MSSNLIYSPSAARVLNSILSNEHTAGDRTPYCYLIGWTKQNLWYYGRRTAKECHPSEFWKSYFTSCAESNDPTVKTVWTCIRDYGQPDVIKIARVFYDHDSCASWETRFLNRVNAARNPKFLNRTNGDIGFDNTGKVFVRDVDGNTLSVSSTDPRFLSGELISVATGFVTMTDVTTGQNIYVSVNDPRIGVTLFHPSLGMIYVTNSKGEGIYCSITDERYTSGEYKHSLQTGIQLISPDGKMFVCPREDEHLYPDHKRNLEGTVFAEDLNGNIHKVSTDDVRLLTGELTCLAEGKVAVIDSNGNSYRVACEEYYANKGTKYVTATTGTVPVRLPSGECVRIATDDPRYLSGELVSLHLGMTTVIDPNTGKRIKVSMNDERIKSGELIKSNYDKEKHNGRIDMMRSMCDRQEVKDLRSKAEELEVKLPMNWEKRKDLSVIWKLLDQPM